jgi:hypothetical protein
LRDNETWTSVGLKADQDGVLRMKMRGVDDKSTEKCGISRTMIVTISNFNKPTPPTQSAYEARMLQSVVPVNVTA